MQQAKQSKLPKFCRSIMGSKIGFESLHFTFSMNYLKFTRNSHGLKPRYLRLTPRYLGIASCFRGLSALYLRVMPRFLRVTSLYLGIASCFRGLTPYNLRLISRYPEVMMRGIKLKQMNFNLLANFKVINPVLRSKISYY
jgi:hypothetical protein